MAQLQLTNIIDISVSATPSGVSAYNTSNLALFTTETPDPVFDDDYKIYLEPTEVGQDFGTSSVTYKMALAVFSQQPNILAGGGYLVVIPFEPSETLDAAVTRTADLVQYFGLMSTQIESGADMQDAAAVVQALNKIAFFVQRASGSIDSGGDLDDLRTGGFTQSRGLYYGAATDLAALQMQAAYAGRALSVNFSGSNTTTTMHLKDLTGVQPDPSMTQTLLNKAQDAGADVYASFQGVPKVYTSGANSFFDQVYNLQWFVGALQVAGFNFLAQASTKVPQTESGMDGLKGAYRAVCEQAVTNQYVAPGVWNSPTTFGNQADLLANVSQRGYYIYSQPVAQQLQVNREAREAPIIQIAVKEAGAIQSSTVIVNVNV
jgi:hypothetical protein